jgi:broad specificity phosphatase PhoE
MPTDAATQLCNKCRRGARRPLLVTHEMVGLMLLRRLLDLPPEDALARSIPQGVMLEIAPARKAIRETGHR